MCIRDRHWAVRQQQSKGPPCTNRPTKKEKDTTGSPQATKQEIQQDITESPRRHITRDTESIT
eukprot:12384645-Prorocentrum_lima.AAC.1